MSKLRLAVITDIHYGLDDRAKLGSKAPKLMDAFAKAVEKHRPRLIVDIGDRVTTKSAEGDRNFMEEVAARFNKLAAPVVSVMGNHDIYRLSPAENERITGSPATHHSMDIDGHHLVFFNPVKRSEEHNVGVLMVEKDDLKWLEDDLAATNNPTIVFSHVPLDNVSEQKIRGGNPYFAGKFGYPIMGASIREIMEDSGKVILCMSGHIHRNRYREINNIHYITQQAFTHQYKEKYRVPSRAWSMVEIENGEISFRRFGKPKDSMTLQARPVI